MFLMIYPHPQINHSIIIYFCGILAFVTQEEIHPTEMKEFYANFDAPIAHFDCGKKCAPHNESGKPFCCDICHAVPTAYQSEWTYLLENTNLWHAWKAEQCTDTPEEAAAEVERLRKETPDAMVLMECLGPEQCQRDFRALTCRQFPFFPYIDSAGNFLGLSIYWEYEDECWVMNHLEVVTSEYLQQFIEAFEFIFSRMPQEFENYKVHSEVTRDEMIEMKRALPLLHRNGKTYKVTPSNERMRRVSPETFPKFGPYKQAAKLSFEAEIR